MNKEEMRNLLKDFLQFADQQYSTLLREFDTGSQTHESVDADEIIDHFLEGDEE